MTNRDMVKPSADEAGQTPKAAKPPPMPADEDGRRPTTDSEPVDSPQPNASVERKPPGPGEIGLTTER